MNELDIIFMAKELEDAKAFIASFEEERFSIIITCKEHCEALKSKHELEKFKLKLKFKVLLNALQHKEAEIQKLNDAIDRYYSKMERVW